MHGTEVGTLAVYVMTPDGLWQFGVWSRQGPQHFSLLEIWSSGSVNLGALHPNAIKVRFRMTASGGYIGDIGFDYIRIH